MKFATAGMPSKVTAGKVPDFAWLNGKVVPWPECVVHARSQGGFWGANIFEGIRGYWQEGSSAMVVFRLNDHLERFYRAAHMLRLPIHHHRRDIVNAIRDTLLANDFRADVHICVSAFFDVADNLEPMSYTENSGMHITIVPVVDREFTSIALGTSSWRRMSDDAMPARIKCGANYHNSRLAHHEAQRNGYNTALLLNSQGKVAEAPGACVVMIRDQSVVSPPATAGAVPGITLNTVARLARERNVNFSERELDRTELYQADEVFLCGTKVGILPVTSLDRIPIGFENTRPITSALQADYGSLMQPTGPHGQWRTEIKI